MAAHKLTFDDLPGWTFEADEISAGVYEATGTSEAGATVRSVDTDPDRAVDACRRAADPR